MDGEKLAVAYMTKLLNAEMKSYLREDIVHYLKSIGMKDPDKIIDSLVRKKVVLVLKNRKICLNLHKKKFRN